MKKMMIFALSAIMVLSMAACGAPAKHEENKEQSTSENVQIPDPWKEVSSMDEARSEVGFDIVVPESIDGYTEKVIRTSTDPGIMEVIFRNEDNELRFRKGTGDGDISGDYNTYSEENTVELNGLSILMKGSDGKVNLSTWSNSGYSYSIDSKIGLSKTEMTGFASYVSDDQLIIGSAPATWEPAIAENVILIRKAGGSEDIRSDYNTYTQEGTATVGDMEVMMKGNDGLIDLAVWTSGVYLLCQRS